MTADPEWQDRDAKQKAERDHGADAFSERRRSLQYPYIRRTVNRNHGRGLRGRPAELERGQRTSSPHGRGPRTRNTPVRRGLPPRMRWSTRAPVTTCRVPASGGPWPVDALDERRASGTSPSAFSTVNSPPRERSPPVP